MAQYKYLYREVLERTVIVDRPDDALPIKQRIREALEDAERQYHDEEVVLTGDDCTERSIQVVDLTTGDKYDI